MIVPFLSLSHFSLPYIFSTYPSVPSILKSTVLPSPYPPVRPVESRIPPFLPCCLLFYVLVLALYLVTESHNLLHPLSHLSPLLPPSKSPPSPVFFRWSNSRSVNDYDESLEAEKDKNAKSTSPTSSGGGGAPTPCSGSTGPHSPSLASTPIEGEKKRVNASMQVCGVACKVVW